MRDNPSNTGFLDSEILQDLAFLADKAVRQFIEKRMASKRIFSESKAFERILDVDVTIRIDNTNNSEFNMDIQVSLTLPPFITMNEDELAEEAANYALEEVEKKYNELKRIKTSRI